MSNVRNLEELTKILEVRKIEASALLEAWKNVTRNYKKDGSSFSVLSKNFNNVSVIDCSYAMHAGEKEIKVHINKNGKWYNDEVKNVLVSGYKTLELPEDRFIKEAFLTPYAYLTPDEIWMLIEKKIEYYTGRIASLEEQIEQAKNVYDEVIKKVQEINAIIKPFKAEHTDTFYALEEIAKYNIKSY